MKNGLAAVAAVIAGLGPLGAVAAEQAPKPRYDLQGRLLRASDYRDWEFLSAGYGMNYSPAADSHPLFTNVFVQRWAYEAFVQSGKWPEQTMFVIDERDARSRGSINKTGHYQTELMGLAVEIKDSAHNPGTWAYYGFSANSETATALPPGNDCEVCHAAHGAVEHTFVQFYPTLKPVAKKFGAYDERREQVHDLK
jgi:Cytochrome P460